MVDFTLTLLWSQHEHQMNSWSQMKLMLLLVLLVPQLTLLSIGDGRLVCLGDIQTL